MTTNDTGVDAREEELLREGFEEGLAAIGSGLPPTDGIIGAGRRIRRRRHWTNGALATVAAAGVSLSLLASGTLGGAHGTVAPASSAPPAVKNRVTANSATSDTAHGLVGSGTVDGMAWQATLTDSAKPWAAAGYQITVGPAGGLSSPGGHGPAAPPTLSDSVPLKAMAEWNFANADEPSSSRPAYYVRAGEVPNDAGSIVVDYADGTTATFPVLVEGGRHVAVFAGPAGYDVTRISVYSTHADLIAYSVPSNSADEAPYVFDATWHQAAPQQPLGTVTLNGTFEGSPYALRMVVHVAGVCTDFIHDGTDTYEGCDTSDSPAGSADVAGWTAPGAPYILYGYTDPGVGDMKLNLKHVTVKNGVTTLTPSTAKVSITWGGQFGKALWSAVIPAGEQVVSYTIYDFQGKAVQTFPLGD